MSAIEFRKLGQEWGGEDWQRPLARALVAAGMLSGAHADVSVRRYASGARDVPDDVLDWLRTRAQTTVRWLIGRTETGKKAVAHLSMPRFYAVVEKGALSRVEWIDAEPDRRTGGKLLAEALQRAA